MNLLIAEDNKDLSEILKVIFEKNGYQVFIVEDGNSAIEAVEKDNNYNLLISDVMMPQKDGFEVVKEIRKNNKELPIIMLTAKSDIKDKIKALSLGANEYITKPFEFEELIKKVKKYTENR